MVVGFLMIRVFKGFYGLFKGTRKEYLKASTSTKTAKINLKNLPFYFSENGALKRKSIKLGYEAAMQQSHLYHRRKGEG